MTRFATSDTEIGIVWYEIMHAHTGYADARLQLISLAFDHAASQYCLVTWIALSIDWIWKYGNMIMLRDGAKQH